MQPIPVSHSYDDRYVPAVIGKDICILNGEYDPDQLWLPFAGAVIMIKVPNPEYTQRYAWQAPPVGHVPPVKKINPDPARKVRIPAACAHPYTYELDVLQHLLPFKEFQSVLKGDFGRLLKAGFPGWDRNTTNPWFRFEQTPRTEGLICIPFEPANKSAIQTWCEMNCTGRYAVRARFVVLEKLSDATLCKLMWWKAKT